MNKKPLRGMYLLTAIVKVIKAHGEWWQTQLRRAPATAAALGVWLGSTEAASTEQSAIRCLVDFVRFVDRGQLKWLDVQMQTGVDSTLLEAVSTFVRTDDQAGTLTDDDHSTACQFIEVVVPSSFDASQHTTLDAVENAIRIERASMVGRDTLWRHLRALCDSIHSATRLGVALGSPASAAVASACADASRLIALEDAMCPVGVVHVNVVFDAAPVASFIATYAKDGRINAKGGGAAVILSASQVKDQIRRIDAEFDGRVSSVSITDDTWFLDAIREDRKARTSQADFLASDDSGVLMFSSAGRAIIGTAEAATSTGRLRDVRRGIDGTLEFAYKDDAVPTCDYKVVKDLSGRPLFYDDSSQLVPEACIVLVSESRLAEFRARMDAVAHGGGNENL